MRLGAYAVPVNWHFKPEEINYILKDSGTSVLIGHADMLHQLRDADSRRRHRAQRPDAAGNPAAITRSIPIIWPRPISRSIWNPGSASRRPMTARRVPQPQNMIYTSGTTGHPKGVRRNAPTPEQSAAVGADARADLRPEAGRARAVAGAAVSFRAEFVRPARRPSRRRAGADAALRPGRIPAADRGASGSTPSSWCRPCSSG